MKTLQLNVLENARSFAVEALRKAVAAESSHDEWKFAVLHVVQAIELSLKEMLRMEHPILIHAKSQLLTVFCICTLRVLPVS